MSDKAVRDTRDGARAPRVTVVIPTYNRTAVLCEAIDSALAQSYQDLEILVVDDGSTDGTPCVLAERFSGRPEVRSLRRDNGGLATARNAGIREARGDLIAFLDSDDLWLPEKLELQVRKLEQEPAAALVLCDRTLGGEPAGSPTRWQEMDFTGDTSLRAIVERGFPISTPSVMVRRRVLEEIGSFDESSTCAQDWDLWIRVMARHPITFVDHPLAIVRRLGDSISQTRALEKWRCWLRLWKKHEDLLLRSGCRRRAIHAKLAHTHPTGRKCHDLDPLADTISAIGP